MTDAISALTSPAAATPTVPKNRALASDFETFLKMLTIQLKNQDPLNPVDSSEYAVQLATFSSVEQQVQTNDLLKSLAAQLGVSGLSQMGAWVGMEARTPAARGFDGNTPLTLTTETAATANRAQLVVTSASGREVQRLDLPPRGGDVQWSGRDAFGYAMLPGLYNFSVESYIGEDLLSTTPVQSFSRIVEARIEGGQTVLVTADGAKIGADKVSAMRNP
jgi:flagellar basal-body rod modification protein FlgD